jgi:hypothetical protein
MEFQMPLSVSSAPRQLSDGNSAGTVLGKSPTDLISFYNATPVTQPAGAAELAVGTSLTGGVFATLATSQSPGAVGPNTTVENNLATNVSAQAVTGSSFSIATTDLVVVNKPTAQAGLGVGNSRVSGANALGVTFSNWTAATVTPTTGEKYGIVALRGITPLSPVLSPAAVAPNTTAEQLFTVTGLAAGQCVVVSKPTAQAGLDIVGMRVAANNQLAVTFGNSTAATVTPTASQTYTVFSFGGIDAASNTFNIAASVGAPPVAAISVLTSDSITVTGLATTDTIVGVSKPTVQAGLALLSGFVSGANALGVTFLATTVSVTPTSYESYGVTVFRPSPAAPCVLYSQALSPVGVAANTTAEQGFTVTGLVASSMVWVNKPTNQIGLGITGCRVSGANVLAITYCNATGATITPAAGEIYSIANFQQPVPDNGTAFLFTLTPQALQNTALSNAMRTALVSTGLMAGS